MHLGIRIYPSRAVFDHGRPSRGRHDARVPATPARAMTRFPPRHHRARASETPDRASRSRADNAPVTLLGPTRAHPSIPARDAAFAPSPGDHARE